MKVLYKRKETTIISNTVNAATTEDGLDITVVTYPNDYGTHLYFVMPPETALHVLTTLGKRDFANLTEYKAMDQNELSNYRCKHKNKHN